MKWERVCVLYLTACGRLQFDLRDDAEVSGDTGTDVIPGLLAYWPFDATSGNISFDASGNGHHAQLTNATLVPSLVDQGLSLGVGRHATVSSLHGGVIGASSVTVSLCVDVFANLGPWDMPFYMGGASANLPGIDLELGTSSWVFETSDGDGVDDEPVVSVGDESTAGTGFHCFAVRFDRAAQTTTSFRDGTVADTQPLAGLDPFPAGDTLRFGGDDAGANEIDGILDEARIYDRALTDAEVAMLHAVRP